MSAEGLSFKERLALFNKKDKVENTTPAYTPGKRIPSRPLSTPTPPITPLDNNIKETNEVVSATDGIKNISIATSIRPVSEKIASLPINRTALSPALSPSVSIKSADTVVDSPSELPSTTTSSTSNTSTASTTCVPKDTSSSNTSTDNTLKRPVSSRIAGLAVGINLAAFSPLAQKPVDAIPKKNDELNDANDKSASTSEMNHVCFNIMLLPFLSKILF